MISAESTVQAASFRGLMMPKGSDKLFFLERARQGDSGALGCLLESYRAYLESRIRAEINGPLRPKVSASDITQDVFLRASEKFADFRGTTEAELVSWLRRIAARALAMTVRHYQRDCRDVQRDLLIESSTLDSGKRSSEVLTSMDSTPSADAARREDSANFQKVLSGLRPEYREVILLRHVDGLTFPDIATRLGRTLDSVKNSWVRAIGQLRLELNHPL